MNSKCPLKTPPIANSIPHRILLSELSKLIVSVLDKFVKISKLRYLDLEKLTPTVLNDLVNAVYVHAPDKSSGQRVQDITISYNYIGILPAHLLSELRKEKTA